MSAYLEALTPSTHYEHRLASGVESGLLIPSIG